MSPARVIAATGALLLVAHLAGMEIFRKPDGRVVFGDATHHFVQLRSIVFDRDLHFQNEYTRIYNLKGGEPDTEWVTTYTPTGHVRNLMPVGPALLWMPLYLVVAGVQIVMSWLGLAAMPDGFDRALQLVPGATGVLATVGAALIAFRIARHYVGDAPALAGVLAVWLGSHALYYSMVSPSYSHAASMLAGALVVWHWIETGRSRGVANFAVAGGLAGMAALMRWQDAIFLVVPLVEAARAGSRWPVRLAFAATAVAGFFVAFLPQMVVWAVLYGQPLAIPQGAGFMQWTAPHLVEVLFSDKHGLITWAPLLIPAFAGLTTLVRRYPDLRVPVALVVLISWYVNAAVADWWAGEAFGSRRFLSLFPLLVLGLAWWMADRSDRSRVVRWRVVTVALLAGANLLLLLQYQLYMKGLSAISPYPGGWFDMFLARFVVPWRLLQSWMN